MYNSSKCTTLYVVSLYCTPKEAFLKICFAFAAAVGIHLPKYNIVPNLLKLLSYNILDSGERFSIILTLGHCTEVCGKILNYILFI